MPPGCRDFPAIARLPHGLFTASIHERSNFEPMSTEPSATTESDGIRTLESRDTFSGTVARLTSALEAHGIKIFATIDQQAEARAAGLEMRPVTLILFGNPKAGTPLMVARPTSALDLPLKAVVWAPENGGVFVSFNTAAYLIARHHLPETFAANLAPAEKLIASALLAP